MVFGLCSSGSVYLLSCSCSARFFVLFLSALVLNGIEWDLCAEVRSEVTAKPRSGSTLVNGAGGMFGEGLGRSALHLPGSRRLLISGHRFSTLRPDCPNQRRACGQRSGRDGGRSRHCTKTPLRRSLNGGPISTSTATESCLLRRGGLHQAEP